MVIFEEGEDEVLATEATIVNEMPSNELEPFVTCDMVEQAIVKSAVKVVINVTKQKVDQANVETKRDQTINHTTKNLVFVFQEVLHAINTINSQDLTHSQEENEHNYEAGFKLPSSVAKTIGKLHDIMAENMVVEISGIAVSLEGMEPIVFPNTSVEVQNVPGSAMDVDREINLVVVVRNVHILVFMNELSI